MLPVTHFIPNTQSKSESKSEMPQQKSAIESLPVELLCKIFKSIDIQDFTKIMKTSKSMRTTVSDMPARMLRQIYTNDFMLETNGDQLNIVLSDKAKTNKDSLAHTTKSEYLIRYLACDTDKNIRANITENANTSKETLKGLAQDPNLQVQAFVAKNRNTSEETLDELAAHTDWRVRINVAKNSNTSKATLEYFTADPNQWVRLYASRNLETPKS